jgi:hypothetical protein
MAGVDLAMEGIPRYAKDLFFFFFLSFEVDAFEARHDVSNQQQHAFFDQDSTMLQCAECLFSPHAYALNVHTLLRCLLYSKTNS